MKITLNPSYATTNTVRFDEVTNSVAPAADDFLAATPKPAGAMGAPLSQYFTGEQLAALGWKPTQVGDTYIAEGSRGKTYTRRDVAGPSIVLDIKVV